MSELFFEIATISLFMASGFAVAKLLKIQQTSHALALGLGLSVLWRTLSHSLLYFIGLGQYSPELWALGSILAIVVAAATQLRNGKLWAGFGFSSILALVAALSTRGLGIRGIPHSDSLWILTLADLFQRNGDMEIVGGRTAIKRGFAYPLTLALGLDGSQLTGLTPLIYLALVIGLFWAVSTLAPKLDLKQWLWIALPVLLVLTTAPIVLRAVWYVNGHTLTALGVLLAVTSVVVSVREKALTRQLLVTLTTGLALISLTRPEGVAVAAVIAAPLISKRWISRWDVRIIAGSALLSFGVWMYLYDGYIPNLIRMYDERFPILMLILSFAAGMKIFDWLRFRLVPIAISGMALMLGVVLVRSFGSLTDDIWAQIQNMFLGAGFWGTFFIAVIAGLALIGVKGQSESYRLLLIISLMLVLGSLAAKLLDGGLFGDPTLGRVGWTDSLNRMWLHSFGIFLVTLFVGYAERISQRTKDQA